jgi:hypothetical protein
VVAGGDFESMCCAWRRVPSWIVSFFTGLSRSAADIPICGIIFVDW